MFSNHLPVIFLLLSSTAAMAAPSVLVDEAWEGFSAPEIIGSGFTHNLFALPLEGSVEMKGPKHWSSDYWPSQKGGINLRWNTSDKRGFGYRSPTYSEVRNMSQRQLMELSPTEKYDILTARYNYPLKSQVAQSVSPKADEWEGICHGWAVATTYHNEPTPKTMRNADGIEVPFGSADIKALLSYYYAMDEGPSDNMGHRCDIAKWTGGAKECDQDLNAGAFHIILANKIALKGEGLIMDVDRLKEVWNQPVVSYKSKVLGTSQPSRNAARSAVIEYRIATELFYVDESDPNWNTVHGTENQKLDKKDLVYRIELNAQDEIVGGTWESDVRPDFVWQKSKIKSFTGLFTMLPSLLNDTEGGARTTAPRDYRDTYRSGRPPEPDFRNDPRFRERDNRNGRRDDRDERNYRPRDNRDNRNRDPYFRNREEEDRYYDRHHDDNYREGNDLNGNGIPDEDLSVNNRRDERRPERPDMRNNRRPDRREDRRREGDRFEDEDEEEHMDEEEY